MLEALRRGARGLIPTQQALAQNRWLRRLGPALHQPRLWHISRRGIAAGCAIGVFFGLLVPIAQIPFAAGAAVLMRANVPAAVASTLVTNPVTFAPVYYAAWRVGSTLLGEAGDAPPSSDAAPAAGVAPTPPGAAADRAVGGPAGWWSGWWSGLWQGLARVGKPLLLGLVLFAIGFGLAVYALVHLLWRLHVRFKRRRRLRALRSAR